MHLLGLTVFLNTICLADMPSSFEMGRSVGGNISKGLHKVQERQVLDQIIADIDHCKTREDILAVSYRILREVPFERQSVVMQILWLKQTELESSVTH